jgi:hypothetical protein
LHFSLHPLQEETFEMEDQDRLAVAKKRTLVNKCPHHYQTGDISPCWGTGMVGRQKDLQDDL